MTKPEPLPEGATWAVRDPEGRIVQYSTEPVRLEMTTQIGEALPSAASETKE